MPVVFDHEKIFERYLYLPAEVRMMVIDEMQPDDRCRFTRCSRISRKQAHSSKNFCYELKIHGNDNVICVFVHFTKLLGFYLKFENNFDEFIIQYFQLPWNQLWEIELHDLTDWKTFVVQHVENLLQPYPERVKSLDLQGAGIKFLLEENDFVLKNLARLENVHVTGDIDPRPILAKLRRPLKELMCFQRGNVDIFKKSEQVYSVSNSLNLPHLKLNYQQFQRLSASRIIIHIGNLTVQNITMFIKSWKNGKLRDNFQRCEWRLKRSRFNKDEVFEDLGVKKKSNAFHTHATIKHGKEAGKTAELVFYRYRNTMEFRVNEH